MTHPSTLAVYMRVSSDEQREQQTIKMQRSAAERYLAAEGDVVPYSWYVDEGVSGTLALRDRPEGRRLLEDAAAGYIKTVLFYKLDRMGRHVRVLIDARDELLKLGVELVSVNEHLDTSNAAGRMFFNQLSVYAEFDRDRILEVTGAGTIQKAHAGVWLGGSVPFGYRLVGQKKDARLVLDEEPLPDVGLSPVDVVRLIFRRLTDDGWSCQRVADELNARGVPTATGVSVRAKRRPDAVWRPTRVYNLVHQSTYMGLHRYGKKSKSGRPRIEREVPAIVDAPTWERAQEALHQRLLWSARNAKNEYLLRGLIVCAQCGLTYQGTTIHPDSDKWRYYVCPGHKRAKAFYGSKDKACSGRSVHGVALEDQVWAEIEHFLRNPGAALDELAARLGEQADHSEALRQHIAERQKELHDKQTEKDAVIALYRRGRIDEGDLDRQLDQIKAEEAAATRQIVLLQEQAANARAIEDSLHSAEALLTRLGARVDEPHTFEWKRHCVETLVDRIVVTTTPDATTGKLHADVDVSYRFAAAPARIGSRAVAHADTPPPHPDPSRPAHAGSAARRRVAP
jgi:site-specific DNA recombinase